MRTPVLRRTTAGPVLAVVGGTRWAAQEHIEGRRFTGSDVEADIWLAEQAGLLHRLDPWPEELDLTGPGAALPEGRREGEAAGSSSGPLPGTGPGEQLGRHHEPDGVGSDPTLDPHPDVMLERVLAVDERDSRPLDLTRPAGWEQVALQGARLDRSWASAVGRRAHELDALERWSRGQSLTGTALCNLDLRPASILVDDEEQWWVRRWSSADLDHPHNEIGAILLRHLGDPVALVRIAAAYGQSRGEPVTAEPELFASAVAEQLSSLGLLTWLDSDDGDVGGAAAGGAGTRRPDAAGGAGASSPILDLIDGIPHMSLLERAADLAARAGMGAARTMGA